MAGAAEVEGEEDLTEILLSSEHDLKFKRIPSLARTLVQPA